MRYHHFSGFFIFFIGSFSFFLASAMTTRESISLLLLASSGWMILMTSSHGSFLLCVALAT